MILLALAAVSAAVFALPSAASAGTPTVDPGGLGFTGTFGLSTLTAEGEPTITCEGENHVTGTFNNPGGNATGGTISLHYTNCHINVFVTIPCHTAGAPLNNTILINNVPFDLTYWEDNKTSPAMLATNVSTEIECGGTTPIKVTGSVMGKVTNKCGEESTSTTIDFSATNNVQDQRQITGTGSVFDLTAQTTGGVTRTAGLNTTAKATLNGGAKAKLTCV